MRDYGIWGKPLQIFEMFEDFRDDPAVQEHWLQEGTGSPEGRADFPYFLQTVIRHKVRERYAAVAAKWQTYTGRENAQDFRETTVSQINGLWGMGQIPEFGEYPRLRSSEEPGPAFAVAKHGGIYEVTMELVINDEADRILGRIPREIGRMAGEYVSLAVVRYIESQPDLHRRPAVLLGRAPERVDGRGGGSDRGQPGHDPGEHQDPPRRERRPLRPGAEARSWSAPSARS